MDKDKKYDSIVDAVKLNNDSKSLLDNITTLKWFFYGINENKYYNKVSLFENEIRNKHRNIDNNYIDYFMIDKHIIKDFI